MVLSYMLGIARQAHPLDTMRRNAQRQCQLHWLQFKLICTINTKYRAKCLSILKSNFIY
ncbi:hypothetical protein [Vibrio gallaecicus]|uniref:hypothetical protein n=1 Tax=Vibrio gallaecicus TaxID=552386 RepID=UPI0025B38190|nr:hypothetical protein [Vibrio gallaecicus]MDN3613286.1 hypothetical protein [Vibrio gallaecicus]